MSWAERRRADLIRSHRLADYANPSHRGTAESHINAIVMYEKLALATERQGGSAEDLERIEDDCVAEEFAISEAQADVGTKQTAYNQAKAGLATARTAAAATKAAYHTAKAGLATARTAAAPTRAAHIQARDAAAEALTTYQADNTEANKLAYQAAVAARSAARTAHLPFAMAVASAAAAFKAARTAYLPFRNGGRRGRRPA